MQFVFAVAKHCLAELLRGIRVRDRYISHTEEDLQLTRLREPQAIW